MPLYSAYISIPVLYGDVVASKNLRFRILTRSTFYGVIGAMILYLVNSISAYLTFGTRMATNVLLSFAASTIWMTICRFLYALSITFSYICLLYPARVILMDIFKLDMNTPKGKRGFYIIGISIVIITVVIAILA